MALNPHAEEILTLDLESCSAAERDETEVVMSEHDGLSGVSSVAPRFHNTPHTKEGQITKEKPWHRIAAYLIASGMTQTKVAEMVQKDKGSVNALYQQRWFQELVSHLIAESGADPLLKLFHGAAVEGFWKLKEMLHDEKTPHAVRAKVAQSFIDREYGTAPQVVEHRKGLSEDPRADADNLYEQLEKLNAAKRAALERKQQTNQNQSNEPNTSKSTGPDFSQA